MRNCCFRLPSIPSRAPALAVHFTASAYLLLCLCFSSAPAALLQPGGRARERAHRRGPSRHPQLPDALHPAGECCTARAVIPRVLHLVDRCALRAKPLCICRCCMSPRRALQVLVGRREKLSVYGNDYATRDGAWYCSCVLSPLPHVADGIRHARIRSSCWLPIELCQLAALISCLSACRMF